MDTKSIGRVFEMQSAECLESATRPINAFRHRVAPNLELAENPGGLNRSMQHWREVYSLEFQSPRSFVGVD
jgi:hypothetical protein